MYKVLKVRTDIRHHDSLPVTCLDVRDIMLSKSGTERETPQCHDDPTPCVQSREVDFFECPPEVGSLGWRG